jgi:hypothetical protein
MAGDYGQAINAANAFASLTAPSTMRACVFGDHPVSTPALIDRPITLNLRGSRLIPQTALGSTPVTITNATVTAGSKTIAVSSTTGLLVNQAVGGLGLTSGSYITAIGSGNITVSLTPNLIVMGFATSGSNQYTHTSSLAGVAVGQGVAGYGIPGGTTISAINYTTQALTLSQNATATSYCTPGAVSLPCQSSVSISSGTWTVPVLTAVKVTPVVTFGYNAGALQNEYGQMIGQGYEGLWIEDTSVRGISGIQGVQIYATDEFKATNLTVNNLKGSALILGSGYLSDTPHINGPVRESSFINTVAWNSGDELTAQPTMAIITGPQAQHASADENNVIRFIGGELATGFGEMLTIGTYNAAHTGYNGPRNLFFTHVQIEGGQYQTAFSRVTSQFDTVGIQQAGDVHFWGAEIPGSGYGKAGIRVDTANTLDYIGGYLVNGSMTRTFTVGVTNGSKNVTLVSTDYGPNQFVTNHTWDGLGAVAIDGGTCTTGSPCYVYLDAANGVTSPTTLQLAVVYAGTTNAAATLQLPTSGYLVNVTGSVQGMNVHDSVIATAPTNDWKSLGLTNASQSLYVGGGMAANPCGQQQGVLNTFIQCLTLPPINVSNPNDSAYLSLEQLYAPNLATGHRAQKIFGVAASTNNSFVESFVYAGAGSASNELDICAFSSVTCAQFFSNGYMGIAGLLVGGNTVLPSTLTGYHGNASGTKVQLSNNSGTSAPAAFDANGNLTAGAAYFITSLTTTGTSGAASVTSGVLNIPQYAGGGSMTYPGVGIAYTSNGTTWGTSLTKFGSAVGLATSTDPGTTAEVPMVADGSHGQKPSASGALGTAAFTASSAYLASGTQLAQTLAAVSHKFVTSYTASTGVFTSTQPACADLSDAASGCSTAAYSLPAATSSVIGGVKPDGTSILNTAGAISVTPSSVGLGSVTNDAQTKAAIVPNTAPSAAQLLLGNAGGTAYAPVSLSGPVSVTSAGVTSVDTLNQNTSGTAATATALVAQAADTVVMNASGGSASPTAVAMPSTGTNGCAGTSNALTYNTSTHVLGCNTISGGGTPSYPVTVAGTVTSGGIPYFSNTTTETSSGILNSNILVKGGGAGGAPTNSSITDDGTTVSTAELVTFSGGSTTSTSGVKFTGTPVSGGSATTTFPLVTIGSGAAGAYNTSGTMLDVNAPTGFSGDLLALRVNGGAYFFRASSASGINTTSIITAGGSITSSSSGAQSVVASLGGVVGKAIGGTTAATLAAGVAAGTSPTIACATSHVCSAVNGTINLTTGTAPATGSLLTITTSLTHTNQPDCLAQVTLTASPYTNPLSGQNPLFTYSTTVWTLNVSTALTASTAYTVIYSCLGY